MARTPRTDGLPFPLCRRPYTQGPRPRGQVALLSSSAQRRPAPAGPGPGFGLPCSLGAELRTPQESPVRYDELLPGQSPAVRRGWRDVPAAVRQAGLPAGSPGPRRGSAGAGSDGGLQLSRAEGKALRWGQALAALTALTGGSGYEPETSSTSLPKPPHRLGRE